MGNNCNFNKNGIFLGTVTEFKNIYLRLFFRYAEAKKYDIIMKYL